MHCSAGVHSALAIKRQRRMREQAKKRAECRERRLSSRTSSFDGDSIDHLDHRRNHISADQHIGTSIGMLHIGVCFIVFGMFLIGSGILPDEYVTWRGGSWWNELVATGIFVVAIGIFLIALNRVVSRKEEENLNEYVQRQLTRSRSGHRLERDQETGCLTTKNHKRLLDRKREDLERGLNDITPVHSPLNKNAPTTVLIMSNGDAAYLEKIMEEDVFMPTPVGADEESRTKETMSTTTTASMSPGTPSETKELLNGRHHSFNSRQY